MHFFPDRPTLIFPDFARRTTNQLGLALRRESKNPNFSNQIRQKDIGRYIFSTKVLKNFPKAKSVSCLFSKGS